jgi:hypothetical protein
VDIIAERAAPKNRMAAAVRNLVVEACDVPVIVRGYGSSKSVSDKVDAVALAGIKVRCREFIKII